VPIPLKSCKSSANSTCKSSSKSGYSATLAHPSTRSSNQPCPLSWQNSHCEMVLLQSVDISSGNSSIHLCEVV
jgi:hypothetical protein